MALKTMANKKKMIYIRVTEEEWNKIEKRIQDAGMKNWSAYFRKMALNGYILNLDLSDVKEVLRLLHINSNNLNQYAKRANETGSIYLTDILDLQKSQEKILKILGEILERLSLIA